MNFNYILQVVGSFSDSDFVNWASEQKIIQDINQLHFCSSCYNLMKLCYSDRYPDGHTHTVCVPYYKAAPYNISHT